MSRLLAANRPGEELEPPPIHSTSINHLFTCSYRAHQGTTIAMAIAPSLSPTYLPISALLPPSREPHSAPHHPLPSPSAAILGPLPPTTPLHLALNWLALSALPEYESAVRLDNEAGPSRHQAGPAGEAATEGGQSERRKRRPERVLIITGRKDEFYQALQDDDEDWMRDHGSDYTVLDRLKRVDVR
jgi:hypothetical protein